MFELLNTLYVQTPGASLHLDHDAVRVVIEGETRLRAPLLRLENIVVFGPVAVSPQLIHRCADDGRSISFMTTGGRFKARLEGPVRGNVLLRRSQRLALDNSAKTAHISRQFVAAKIQNSRLVLLRGARESRGQPAGGLRSAAEGLADILNNVHGLQQLDQLRGAEGEAARIYFQAFNSLIRSGSEGFSFERRSRRPPRDRINSLLSFLYTLVRGECASALEGVGLDPQVGYLHSLRPGRPALALDLMEELRPPGRRPPGDHPHQPASAESGQLRGAARWRSAAHGGGPAHEVGGISGTQEQAGPAPPAEGENIPGARPARPVQTPGATLAG